MENSIGNKIKLANVEECTACGACYSVCPKSAIFIIVDVEGFFQPIIDNEKCIKCDLCVKTCPIINKKIIDNNVFAYAAINRNKEVREKSSSGGIFSIFAENCIKSGGVVFGSRMNDDFTAKHSYTENIEGLSEFYGSKYVQSYIGDSFIHAKEFLEAGRNVFFSGTPCQIAGLRRYLKHDYENLLTMDFVCHGVPNSRLLKSYIHFQESKYKRSSTQIAFRRKYFGWKQFAIAITFSDGTAYCQSQTTDYWMLAFNKNIMLRKSCYSCSYKTKERESDITVADLWGIDFVAPELDDNKGTSLLLIQNEKGKNIFESLRKKMIYKTIDFNAIKDFNSFHQTELHPCRNEFITECFNNSFDSAYKKYVAEYGVMVIYRKGRRILGKIKQRMYKTLGIGRKDSTNIVDDLLESGKNVE